MNSIASLLDRASDPDQIEILLRRSTNGGRTFDAPRSIAQVPGPKTKNPFALRLKNVNPDDVTYNNPVLIADRDGTVQPTGCLQGALGQRIYENVSKLAWQRWLKHQTMLINEYRLTPVDPKARKMLEGEMEKFFFGDGSSRPDAFVEPGK